AIRLILSTAISLVSTESRSYSVKARLEARRFSRYRVSKSPSGAETDTWASARVTEPNWPPLPCSPVSFLRVIGVHMRVSSWSGHRLKWAGTRRVDAESAPRGLDPLQGGVIGEVAGQLLHAVLGPAADAEVPERASTPLA